MSFLLPYRVYAWIESITPMHIVYWELTASVSIFIKSSTHAWMFGQWLRIGVFFHLGLCKSYLQLKAVQGNVLCTKVHIKLGYQILFTLQKLRTQWLSVVAMFAVFSFSNLPVYFPIQTYMYSGQQHQHSNHLHIIYFLITHFTLWH